MCGIGGLVHSSPDADVPCAVLEMLGDSQAHRGPDDAGIWREGRAGLVHRRLSVLDPSPAGHQPMMSRDGRFVVVFNGEIYNFQDIRTELETRGHEFHTQCDTEVLLEAWSTWGADALTRLNGMFAFAVYDRETGVVTLARDRLGVKPLFYTLHGGMLAFASELGALTAAGLAGGALNPAAIDAYFTYLYIPAPDTIFRGVYKLRPGEMLTFRDGALHTARYWRLHPRPDPRWRMEDAAERTLELLRDAVRLRRISDVPLGAFLSGGMDSSAITALLSASSGGPVKTFTIGFNDAEADELRYARRVANHCGTDHAEAVLAPDMVALAPRIARHFGEPFADSSALPVWLVSEVARRQVTVALSGDGGDELFGGYTWMRMNRAVARYRRVPEALRRGIDRALALGPDAPRLARLRRFSADSFLEPIESFRRRLTCFGADQRAGLYHETVRAAIAASREDRFLEHAAEAAQLSMDDRMLYLDTVMYLPDDILTKVDRMSMAHGLEARTPMLDYRLVEFAATLPFELKLSGGVSKQVLKHAMRGLLPECVLTERKRGFALPIQRWFRGTLGKRFEETVLAEDALASRFLAREPIARLFSAHRAGRGDFGHHLWALLMFEMWLREVDTRRTLYLE